MCVCECVSVLVGEWVSVCVWGWGVGVGGVRDFMCVRILVSYVCPSNNNIMCIHVSLELAKN